MSFFYVLWHCWGNWKQYRTIGGNILKTSITEWLNHLILNLVLRDASASKNMDWKEKIRSQQVLVKASSIQFSLLKFTSMQFTYFPDNFRITLQKPNTLIIFKFAIFQNQQVPHKWRKAFIIYWNNSQKYHHKDKAPWCLSLFTTKESKISSLWTKLHTLINAAASENL